MRISVNILMIMTLAAASFGRAFTSWDGGDAKKITVDRNDLKQITIRGELLNVNIIGEEKKDIVIYVSKKAEDPEKLTSGNYTKEEDIISEYKAEFTELFGKDTELRLKTVKKELEIDVDSDDDMSYLTVFTPRDISLVITIDNGDMKLKGIKGEIILDGKLFDTEIDDVSGVLNYRNKDGDLNVNGFEGVMDIKTYTGDIKFISSQGSLKLKNVSGDLSIEKFSGKITAGMEVGDLKISGGSNIDLNVESQSGDISLNDFKGGNVRIKSSLGEVSISDFDLSEIKADLSAGELYVKNGKADLDLNLNLGEVKMKKVSLNGKKDSDISLNFGDVDIELDDPTAYTFFKSVNEEEIKYNGKISVSNDLKICGGEKKCLRISVNIGDITVK